jgi:hypothetical protein
MAAAFGDFLGFGFRLGGARVFVDLELTFDQAALDVAGSILE